jgi:type VI secretion system Hcp family effector
MKGLVRLLGICFLTGGIVNAYAGGFVRFEGIDGESVVEGYENWSEFLSVVQEIVPAERPSAVVTKVNQAPQFKEISVIKVLDKASPKIAQLALRLQVIPRVEIEWTRNINGVEQPYYTYRLTNAVVTEYSSKGFGNTDLDSATDGQIKEKISLDFQEIRVRYYEYDEQGSLAGIVEYDWFNK